MNAFRNAFKIIADRFVFLWTLIAYYGLAVFLLVSICLSVLIPYLNAIIESNLIQRISEIGQAIVAGSGMEDITGLFNALTSDLARIFTGTLGLSTIGILLLLSVVWRFILGLADVAFYHVIDMRLCSAAKETFRSSFIKNVGKGAKYQLSKMLISLPVDGVIYGVIYLASLLFSTPVLFIFAPFTLLLLYVLLYSARLSLFSGWIPEILHSEHKRIFPAFKSSLKLLGKNFWRVYTAMLLNMLVVIAINLFFGIFTLGVGLLITVPLTFYILMALNSTLYYQNRGLRYYVNKDTIVNSIITASDEES